MNGMILKRFMCIVTLSFTACTTSSSEPGTGNTYVPSTKDAAADYNPIGQDGAVDAPQASSSDAADGQAPVQKEISTTNCNASESPFKGHCYSAPGFKYMDYPAAKDLCEKFGAHIVTITAADENEFVYKLFPASSYAAWIGLKRNGSNKQDFVWETGAQMNYTNWAENEPNNENGTENCTIIWGPALSKETFRSKWNDTDCTVGRDTVICERIP